MLQARQGLASPHEGDSHVTEFALEQRSTAFRRSRSYLLLNAHILMPPDQTALISALTFILGNGRTIVLPCALFHGLTACIVQYSRNAHCFGLYTMIFLRASS